MLPPTLTTLALAIASLLPSCLADTASTEVAADPSFVLTFFSSADGNGDIGEVNGGTNINCQSRYLESDAHSVRAKLNTADCSVDIYDKADCPGTPVESYIGPSERLDVFADANVNLIYYYSTQGC